MKALFAVFVLAQISRCAQAADRYAELEGDSHWFSVVIPSGKVDCFFQVLEASTPVRVTAVVVNGGKYDLRLLVRHTINGEQVLASEPRLVHVKTFVDTKTKQHLDTTK